MIIKITPHLSKRWIYTILAFLFIFIAVFVIVMNYMKSNNYIVSTIYKPNYIPKGFKLISVEKKIPPEKDWVIIMTYENSKKQQIVFDEEPRRSIRCWQEQWKKNFMMFRPKNASEGCSFYMDHLNNENKNVSLHWFLWNVNDTTYAIYDQESVLTNQEVMNMAQSIGSGTAFIKDLTKQ